MPRARLGAPVAKYKTKNFQQRSVLSVIALAGASRGTGFVQLCRHRLTNNSMGFLQKLLDFLGLSGQKVCSHVLLYRQDQHLPAADAKECSTVQVLTMHNPLPRWESAGQRLSCWVG